MRGILPCWRLPCASHWGGANHAQSFDFSSQDSDHLPGGMIPGLLVETQHATGGDHVPENQESGSMLHIHITRLKRKLLHDQSIDSEDAVNDGDLIKTVDVPWIF